jgi:asparagine synthase (glutamine-hydrolysing)
MISEVPLGAFLSGGVDSSAVVATMAGLSAQPVQHLLDRLRRPGLQRGRVRQMVADRYRTDHYVETVQSDDFDLVDTLARLYDEPYADSSAIPTYRVCQLARKRVTVALSGDGGDESFGGYRRYRLHLMEERMRRALPAGLRRRCSACSAASTPRPTGRRACCAPRPPSRAWRAPPWRPTSTACR